MKKQRRFIIAENKNSKNTTNEQEDILSITDMQDVENKEKEKEENTIKKIKNSFGQIFFKQFKKELSRLDDSLMKNYYEVNDYKKAIQATKDITSQWSNTDEVNNNYNSLLRYNDQEFNTTQIKKTLTQKQSEKELQTNLFKLKKEIKDTNKKYNIFINKKIKQFKIFINEDKTKEQKQQKLYNIVHEFDMILQNFLEKTAETIEIAENQKENEKNKNKIKMLNEFINEFEKILSKDRQINNEKLEGLQTHLKGILNKNLKQNLNNQENNIEESTIKTQNEEVQNISELQSWEEEEMTQIKHSIFNDKKMFSDYLMRNKDEDARNSKKNQLKIKFRKLLENFISQLITKYDEAENNKQKQELNKLIDKNQNKLEETISEYDEILTKKIEGIQGEEGEKLKQLNKGTKKDKYLKYLEEQDYLSDDEIKLPKSVFNKLHKNQLKQLTQLGKTIRISRKRRNLKQ